MWDRLLRNARVVDPVNGRDGVMDVAVKDGRIAAVGPNLQGEASEVEDLTGLVVMPGLIDPHLHLGSMFGSAYGTRMAAAAGVTILAMDCAVTEDSMQIRRPVEVRL